MIGVQFITDSKGRKVAVPVDLKKHAARFQDFWDGLVSESRRGEVGIPLEKVKADRGDENEMSIKGNDRSRFTNGRNGIRSR